MSHDSPSPTNHPILYDILRWGESPLQGILLIQKKKMVRNITIHIQG